VLSFINVMFAVMGFAIMVLGIVLFVAPAWARMLGWGPPTIALVFGALELLVAAVGHYGYKRDHKLSLLVYFIMLFVGFVVFTTAGLLVLVDNERYDSKFSSLWCDWEDNAEEAQEHYSCCGYECPLDRPAGGVCPGDVDPFQGGLVLGSTCEDGVRAEGECEGYSGEFVGCKTKAVSWAATYFVPFFILGLAFALCLAVGQIVACGLLCRSTPEGAEARRLVQHARIAGVAGATWDHSNDATETAARVAAQVSAKTRGTESAGTVSPAGSIVIGVGRPPAMPTEDGLSDGAGRPKSATSST
jgi:hypothetical protein